MIGLLVAMEVEAHNIVRKLTNLSTTTIMGHSFYQGQYAQNEVVVAIMGIGKIEAGITTLLMLEHFNPQYLINLGVAGGYDKELQSLDVVVANKVGFYDVDMRNGGDYAFGQMQNFPRFFPCYFQNIELNPTDFKVVTGLILSADTFATDRNALTALFAEHYLEQVLAVDMESAAIAQVSYQHQVPVLVIRAISDVIGCESQLANYYEWRDQAIINMEIVLDYLLDELARKGQK